MRDVGLKHSKVGTLGMSGLLGQRRLTVRKLSWLVGDTTFSVVEKDVSLKGIFFNLIQ